MPTVEILQTRSEIEEALVRYTQDAKAALVAGNVLRWSRRHEQINTLLDEWRWVTFVG